MSEVIYGINPVLEALRSGEREFVKIQIAAGKSVPTAYCLLCKWLPYNFGEK